MRLRRIPLLITLLALLAIGSATAEGETATEDVAPAFPALANTTISCSTAWPSTVIGCFVERPLLVLGDFELAVGVDAQAAVRGELGSAHLAPYLITGVYAEMWSAWAEVKLPDLIGIPVLGAPDWLRVGFTIRIPP